HGQQLPAVETGEIRVDTGVVGHAQQTFTRPESHRAGQTDLATIKGEVTAFQRAQPVADLAALPRLQLDRQRQILETQALWYVIVDLNIQRLRDVMFNVQSHLTPATEGETARHLSPYFGGGQPVQANGVDDSEDKHSQQQSPIGR